MCIRDRFIVHAEERTTKKPEKFMSVHASDTNGDSIRTVRFWHWAEGDIAMGRTYVVRGLKVVQTGYGYTDANTVETCNLTVVEDVTDIEEIKILFD